MFLIKVFLIIFGFQLLPSCFGFLQHQNKTSTLKTLASWVSLDFVWDSTHQKSDFLSSKKFIPEHCALTGIKTYKNDIYVTVPRWLTGVPSTLNKLQFSSPTDKTPLLSPFPDWSHQDVNNPDGFKYIQSMEIDSKGRMWIIDVGRLNIVEKNASLQINGPAKITIFDLETSKVLQNLTLSDEIAPYNSSFLNDIVLDEERGFAYISDTSGAIIIYDSVTNTAKRWASPSMKNEPNVSFTINGIDYGNATFTTAEDGIAISRDGGQLFYCALQGLHLYSIETSYLRNFSNSDEDLERFVRNRGLKKAPSDGLTCSKNSDVLYFGGLTTNSVYSWNFNEDFSLENQKVVSENRKKLQWVDTFAWEGDRLLLTSNRLDLFFSGKMDFEGGQGPNFRVLAIEELA